MQQDHKKAKKIIIMLQSQQMVELGASKRQAKAIK